MLTGLEAATVRSLLVNEELTNKVDTELTIDVDRVVDKRLITEATTCLTVSPVRARYIIYIGYSGIQGYMPFLLVNYTKIRQPDLLLRVYPSIMFS